MTRDLSAAIAFMVLSALSQCTQPSKAPCSDQAPAPVSRLVIARGETPISGLNVSIADSESERSVGLMNVERMCPDKGMVFLFEDEGSRGFHMLNTRIPLDIAFWDESNRVVDKLTMSPCLREPCTVYESRRPFMGAVEANRGRLQDVLAGDVVSLRPLD